MKAVVFERFGGPEVLEYRGVPDPACGPREVVVGVKACGINHLDLWVRMGLPGLDLELPHILGNDVVGIALQAGPEVRHVRPGDSVVTSGLGGSGGIYPKGVRIGTVVRVADDESGATRQVVVRPLVEFGRLEEVYVVR